MTILDGKALAAKVKEEVRAEAERLPLGLLLLLLLQGLFRQESS